MKKIYKKMPSGYGMVQTEIMKLDISIQSKAIYALLASYTGSNQYCWPTIETIGNDMNLSKPMIIKYLKELETENLIKKSKKYPGNFQKNHNQYEIMFLESEADLTSEVKQDLPTKSSTLNLTGKADLTENNNTINNNNLNNNTLSGKPTSLIDSIKNIFNQGHQKLFDSPLTWNGNGAKFMQGIKTLIKNAEQEIGIKPMDTGTGIFDTDILRLIRQKAEIQYKWIKADDPKNYFVKSNKEFSPATLACNWNSLNETVKDKKPVLGSQEYYDDDSDVI